MDSDREFRRMTRTANEHLAQGRVDRFFDFRVTGFYENGRQIYRMQYARTEQFKESRVPVADTVTPEMGERDFEAPSERPSPVEYRVAQFRDETDGTE